MKKSLLLTLFFIFSLSLGFSSNNGLNEEQLNKQQAISGISTYSYQYTSYFVGDLYGIEPTFTVNFSGEFLGCEGHVYRVNGYTFCLDISPVKGNNVCIGHVVTRQNGQVVIYQIYANVFK